jgi:hypothetical protein
LWKFLFGHVRCVGMGRKIGVKDCMVCPASGKERKEVSV